MSRCAGCPTCSRATRSSWRPSNATYVYRLDTNPEALIVPFTGTWVLDPLPKNPQAGGPQPTQRKGQRLITLTTCSEIFHTDDRMIAFGHLVRTVEKER